MTARVNVLNLPSIVPRTFIDQTRVEKENTSKYPTSNDSLETSTVSRMIEELSSAIELAWPWPCFRHTLVQLCFQLLVHRLHVYQAGRDDGSRWIGLLRTTKVLLSNILGWKICAPFSKNNVFAGGFYRGRDDRERSGEACRGHKARRRSVSRLSRIEGNLLSSRFRSISSAVHRL